MEASEQGYLKCKNSMLPGTIDLAFRLFQDTRVPATLIPGYIPRSQEYFGHPYVETTNASLANFQRMLSTKNRLPYRVESILNERKQKLKEGKLSAIPTQKRSTPATNQFNLTDDMSPYRLPPDHPQKTFISGYTGFVPRLQNHFGEV